MFSDNEKTSEFINNLIKLNEDYMQSYNNRTKSSALFNEFEEKAKGDLMDLVKLSNERYKSVKSGNSLNSILKNQGENMQVLVNRVLSEQIYHTDVIKEEKNKYLKYNNAQKNKSMNSVRAKIRENLVNFKKKEVKDEKKILREKFANSISKKNLTSKVKRRETNLNSNESLHQVARNHMGKLEEATNYYSDMIKIDKTQFDTMMNEYLSKISEIKEDQSEGDNKNKLKNLTFLTDDIKMISFKPETIANIIKKKRGETLIDLKKLTKLSKRYKLKNNLPDMQNNIEDFMLENQNLSQKKIKKNEVCNSITLARKEIFETMNIQDNLNSKRRMLIDFLKENQLPQIDQYEKLLLKNFTMQKISQLANEDKLQETIENNTSKSKVDLIKEDLTKTYEDRKQDWDKEITENEKLERIENENKKRNKNFLNKIRKKNRSVNRFIDQYSIREKKTNKNLEELNDYLGRQNVSKKELNKKIDEFISEIEKEEKKAQNQEENNY